MHLKVLSFVDVDTTQKHVTSASYDKQHVWTYLRPFLR